MSDQNDLRSDEIRQDMIRDLVEFMKAEGFTVHAARGVEGFKLPSPVRNQGFGSAKDRLPDAVGFDFQHKRIVLGVVRPDRRSLDSEDALEEYNVFLDHNAEMRDQASVLYVMVPEALIQEFTSLITHYIHRDYWHRVVTVGWSTRG